MVMVDIGETDETFAERADAWRIAHALLDGSDLRLDKTPEDVLDLARFIVGE
jgi:hypothetical protein